MRMSFGLGLVGQDQERRPRVMAISAGSDWFRSRPCARWAAASSRAEVALALRAVHVDVDSLAVFGAFGKGVDADCATSTHDEAPIGCPTYCCRWSRIRRGMVEFEWKCLHGARIGPSRLSPA